MIVAPAYISKRKNARGKINHNRFKHQERSCLKRLLWGLMQVIFIMMMDFLAVNRKDLNKISGDVSTVFRKLLMVTLLRYCCSAGLIYPPWDGLEGITSSTRSVASAGGDRGHSAGKFLQSLHSSRALCFWREPAGSASPVQPELVGSRVPPSTSGSRSSRLPGKCWHFAAFADSSTFVSKQGRTEASQNCLQGWTTRSLQNAIASFYQNSRKAWCIFIF